MPEQTVLDRVSGVNSTNMVHIWCVDCGSHLALCGAPLNGNPETREVECAVCAELERGPCPHCGAAAHA